MSISIFSRAIKTGKSTTLLNWCSKQKNVKGLLMMEENQNKIVYTAHNQQKILYQPSKNYIKIGDYKFDNAVFTKGNELIKLWLEENTFDFLCLDEIGKLELNNKGWHSSFINILKHQKQNINKNYIVVVRDYLVNDVINQYNIKDFTVTNSLEKLHF